MLNVDHLLQSRYPNFWYKRPQVARSVSKALRLLFHEKEFQQFEKEYAHLQGCDFVDEALEYFQFSFSVRENERERIPVSGPVVIVANHPIGSLDGLALLQLFGSVRPDTRVVANDILETIQPLRPLLFPVNNMNGETRQENLRKITRHVRDDRGALIIFPAGEVSRFGPKGIKDSKWKPGFLRIAATCNAPVLPVFVDGRNSAFFYALSFLARPVSTLWLVREMFKQARHCVDIRIGHPVGYGGYGGIGINQRQKAQLFKRHVYQIGRGKAGLLPMETAIAHPENRARLREEIRNCQLLGTTGDGKKIYLFANRADSSIMREIGRLRELSFRAVGEGSGRRRDVDRYDQYYQHLLLWDEQELEIAGGYRFCDASNDAAVGSDALYSTTLFGFTEAMQPYLEQGLELGRSFVQPKYWGKRSLDYLWYGIGAVLRSNPKYRYLFGPVSLSAALPIPAVEMLVHFYQTHFPPAAKLVEARLPFAIGMDRLQQLQQMFPGQDYNDEFACLKQALTHMNVGIPTLYKQYAELCETGGIQYAGSNIDPAFANCVDSFIIVDSHRIKAVKRARYIGD